MQYTQDDSILKKYKAILQEARNDMCHDFCYMHKGLCNLQTPYQFTSLRRHHNLQRSNQVNKKISKITNGESQMLRSTYWKSANAGHLCKKAGLITT